MATKLLIKEYNELVTEQLKRRHEIESEREKLAKLLYQLNINIDSYNHFDKSLDKFKDKLIGKTDTSIKHDYVYECIEYILKNSEKMTIMERLNSGLRFDFEKTIQQLLSINTSRIRNGDNIIALAQTLSYRVTHGDYSKMPEEYKIRSG